MASSVLRHGEKCGGDIFVDIAPLISFTTPSMAFTPEGLTLGVMEFSLKSSGGKVNFHCRKCSADFPLEDTDRILVECSVCYKEHPVSETFSSQSLAVICDTCAKVVSGEIEPKNEAQRRIVKFMSFGGNLKFVPFSTVLGIIKF